MNEVTNDTWIANFAGVNSEVIKANRVKDPNPLRGYEPKIGIKSPPYLAMSGGVRRAAKVLSQRTGDPWTPAEI